LDTSSNFIFKNDYWIVKTNSLGIKEWDKDFGGSGIDKLYSRQQATDKGYILGGYSYSDSGGDKTQNCWHDSVNHPSVDYWIIKTDSLGNKQWDKDFGGTGLDVLSFVQQTIDGGYILGGTSIQIQAETKRKIHGQVMITGF
jgi:hypothetical protein